MNRNLYLVTGNAHKAQEAAKILAPAGVDVLPIALKIEEIQTEDAMALVRDKVLKAFHTERVPLFVEHTGLYLRHLNGLPGGLTQIFWDRLEADRFAELFGRSPDTHVIARTTVGYIDGRRIHFFNGEVSGTIVSEPRGSRDFQWDCVFQPEGHGQTFAEMGEKKNEISMRKQALDAFSMFLRDEG